MGVPSLGCHCRVCTSSDPHDNRLRPSLLLSRHGQNVVIDTTPDFRQQALRVGLDRLDAIVLTHGHADHIAGMDDLRRFCDQRGGEALPIYSTDVGMARVRAIYPYAIRDHPITRGYPAFRLLQMPAELDLAQGTIRSTLLPHGGVSTLGLVFTERSSGKKFVYYSDCKRVPSEAAALARGAEAVVLDGLRPEPHPSHMSIDEAIAASREIGAPATYLTHLTHHTEFSECETRLPDGVKLAYDGLRLKL